MDQPATCSARTFLVTGCEPASSLTGATSTQLWVGAEIRGRRKRKAAVAMDAKIPSGTRSKNERRVGWFKSSIVISANYDARATTFLPRVAIGEDTRQNNFASPHLPRSVIFIRGKY